MAARTPALLAVWISTSLGLLAHGTLAGADSPPIPPGVTVQRDLAYVTDGHPRQKLDLYLPAADAPLPLVVYIHGGAFRAGDKGDHPPLEYVDQGYALAAVNYRLSQHAVFPAQIEDCKAAVRWLRANAARYGIDPERIAVGGASAGGHLAAMVGTTGHVRELDVGENLKEFLAKYLR